MDKATLVANLIAHPNTQFEESDKDWLNVLHEGQLEKMLPVDLEDDLNDENLEDDLETNISRLPQDLQEVLNNHLTTLAAGKEAMVTKVLGCTTNKFTKEELEGMALNQLEAIAALVPETPVASEPAAAAPAGNGEPAPAGNADPSTTPTKVEPLSYNTYLGIGGGGGSSEDKGVKPLGINTVSDQLGKDK